MRRAIVALVAFVAATCGRRARAQEPTPPSHGEIVVLPSTCGEIPLAAGAWVDLLRVELAADHVEVRALGGDSPPPSGPRVTLEPSACTGSPTTATLTYSAGELRRSRTVSLVDIEPVARPRVLAMAMAELVRSGMTAGAAVPAVTRAQLDVHVQLDAPPPPPPPPPARTDTHGAAPSLGWFAAAETRAFPQAAGGVFGARAGAHVPVGPWLEWVADAGVLFGSAHDLLGDIDGTVATVGTALLGVGGTSGLVLGVGPRAEAGVGWFRGHATAPGATSSRATAPLALIALSAEASFRVSPPLWGWLGLDVGTSLYGFNGLADNRQVSDFSGPMVSVRIGVLVTP